VKLSTHLHLVLRSRMVEPYLHSPICLHGIGISKYRDNFSLYTSYRRSCAATSPTRLKGWSVWCILTGAPHTSKSAKSRKMVSLMCKIFQKHIPEYFLSSVENHTEKKCSVEGDSRCDCYSSHCILQIEFTNVLMMTWWATLKDDLDWQWLIL
jgi:hypothetical protein